VRKKIIAINVFLIAALFGLVTLNKEILRPRFSKTRGSEIILGCFPNFIAAYIISLAIVNVVLIRKPKYGRLIVYATAVFVFIILTIEEIKPIWGASSYYDSWDILASGLGSFLSILTFELVIFRLKKTPRT
jgi:hypothetical protein